MAYVDAIMKALLQVALHQDAFHLCYCASSVITFYNDVILTLQQLNYLPAVTPYK